jgi:hypothetical protein
MKVCRCFDEFGGSERGKLKAQGALNNTLLPHESIFS